MPKVSVILTSYNHAKYLRESIESVLNQTFSDFELIIGDDASTDESWEIIQSYRDPRIHAFRHETNRLGGIINDVLLSGRASGEFIAIHHSDDAWEPQKLEKQAAVLDENPEIGAVFTDVSVVGENSELLPDSTHDYQTIFNQPNRSRHQWLNYFFYRGNALCHPSVLIRRECYANCGPLRYGLVQLGDFDMWVRLCMKYEIHVLPEKLFRLRLRSGELNSSGNRADVRIRGPFEYFAVLENYRKLTSADDLIKVFPIAEKYVKPEGFDAGFILGMAALEPDTYKFTQLFGLQNLFEAVSDPIRARIINDLYGFNHIDFMALTAQHDVFSFELAANLQNQVNALKAEVAEKDHQVQSFSYQLTEIHNSRAWKLISTYREIRSKLFPGI